MKQLIIIAAISISLFSCTSSNNKRDSENLAIVKSYKEAVETNNVSRMDSLLADNYKGYGPSVSDSVNKAQALDNWKYNAENLYETLQFSRIQNIAKTVGENEEAEPGDWVITWAFLTIKYKDGRGPVSLWVNVEYKIEDGKIAQSRTFYDEADVLRQLNYTIEPPMESN
jgi:hypothetical protein